MALPQLIAEDVRELDRLLGDLVTRSEATAALVIDKAGFLISQSGDTSKFDATTLAALAAGSFAATQGMASVVNEPNFNSVYQQGELYSLLVQNIEFDTLLMVIFAAQVSVGAVKYFANSAAPQAARQFEAARQRAPGQTLDLARMNLEDSSEFFRKVAQH
jgi:predicted regulator of Ras-like GTPase activity (Roadblock/LC7/MglB family)